MAPAAKFESVPWSARPTANPAAPSSAIIDVVWMPKRFNTDTTTRVSTT